MKTLNIDPEFSALIPPLNPIEYLQLEANIKEQGCRDAILAWDDAIIDGHNRYEICNKHNIEFRVTEIIFKTREHALQWIILNQFGRRNLTAYDRSVLALKLEGMFKEKGKEKQRQGGEDKVCQKSAEATETRKELAKTAGVSHDTIMKVKEIESRATPETKQRIKDGKLTINKAYNYIKRQDIKEEAK